MKGEKMRICKLNENLIVDLEKINFVKGNVVSFNDSKVGLTDEELQKLTNELMSDETKRIRQLKNISYSLKQF